MANQEKIKKVYDAMSKNYNMPSFDEFSKGLDDVVNRKKVYDAMKEHYSMADDFDGFNSKLGFTDGLQPSADGGNGGNPNDPNSINYKRTNPDATENVWNDSLQVQTQPADTSAVEQPDTTEVPSANSMDALLSRRDQLNAKNNNLVAMMAQVENIKSHAQRLERAVKASKTQDEYDFNLAEYKRVYNEYKQAADQYNSELDKLNSDEAQYGDDKQAYLGQVVDGSTKVTPNGNGWTVGDELELDKLKENLDKSKKTAASQVRTLQRRTSYGATETVEDYSAVDNKPVEEATKAYNDKIMAITGASNVEQAEVIYRTFQQDVAVDAVAPEIDRQLEAVAHVLDNAEQNWKDNYRAKMDELPNSAKFGISPQAMAAPSADVAWHNPARADYDAALAAKHSLKAAKRQIEHYNIERSQRGDEGVWTFTKNAAKGFGERVTDISTWDCGITDFRDAAALLRAVEKQENNQPLTDAERAVLDAAALNMYVQACAKTGLGFQAGDVTAESIPFMLDMMINPIAKTGGSIAARTFRVLTKAAAERGAASALKLGGRRLAIDLLRQEASNLGRGALMAVDPMQIAKTEALIYNEHIGQVTGNFDKNGHYHYTGRMDGKDWGEAIVRGFVQQTIENASEFGGDTWMDGMGDLFKAIGGRQLNRLANSRAANMLVYAFEDADAVRHVQNGFRTANKWLERLGKKEYIQVMNDLRKQAHISGVIGETNEEVLGGLYNCIPFIGDENLLTYTDENGEEHLGVLSPRRYVETAITMLPQQVMMGAMAGGIYGIKKYNANGLVNTSLATLRNMPEFRGMTDDEIRAKFDALNSDDFGRELVDYALTFDNMATRDAVMRMGINMQYAAGLDEAEKQDRVHDIPRAVYGAAYDKGREMLTDEERTDAAVMGSIAASVQGNTADQLPEAVNALMAQGRFVEALETAMQSNVPDEAMRALEQRISYGATAAGVMGRLAEDRDKEIADITAATRARADKQGNVVTANYNGESVDVAAGVGTGSLSIRHTDGSIEQVAEDAVTDMQSSAANDLIAAESERITQFYADKARAYSGENEMPKVGDTFTYLGMPCVLTSVDEQTGKAVVSFDNGARQQIVTTWDLTHIAHSEARQRHKDELQEMGIVSEEDAPTEQQPQPVPQPGAVTHSAEFKQLQDGETVTLADGSSITINPGSRQDNKCEYVFTKADGNSEVNVLNDLEIEQILHPAPVGGATVANAEPQQQEQPQAQAQQQGVTPEIINEAMAEMGLSPAQVNVITSPDQLPADQQQAAEAIRRGDVVEGWYDPKSDKVFIYAPALADKNRTKQVILHELVAHKGLKDLLGKEKFAQLCDAVWEYMPEAERRTWIAYALESAGKDVNNETVAQAMQSAAYRRIAADEYMAHLAETGFADVEPSLLQQIIDAIRKVLQSLQGFEDVEMSDDFIKGLLTASYANLRKSGEDNADSDAMPTKDGKVDWLAATPQRTLDYLTKEQGLTADETADFVAAQLKAASDALAKLQKKQPKIGTDIEAYKQAKAKWQQDMDEAQRNADHWQSVVEELNRPAPTESNATADDKNVPDMSQDRAADARARGFRMANGIRYDRQAKTDGVNGKEVEIDFTTRKTVKGRYKVIDGASLQPSHKGGERNPLHFIPEAQPKERIDQVSEIEARRIAGNIMPDRITASTNAYGGAPVTNSRGEVIQGNNRANALKQMPSDQQAKYKQWLVEHADEFGLNADEVAQMQNPVLVREVDVTDEDAIRLGQYRASDLESGGTERIDARATMGKMNEQTTAAALFRLFEGDAEDRTIGQLIDENGASFLKYLNQVKAISDTQFQSAFKNDKLTDEAKSDIRRLMLFRLFDGGADNLERMFDKMPSAAQKALLPIIAGDAIVPEGASLREELQRAIVAANELMASGFLDGKRSLDDVRTAFGALSRQTDMFASDQRPLNERFSPLELEIAARLLTENQSTLKAIFAEYCRLVIGTEGDMFNPAERLSRAEAVERVFNIKDIKNNETGGETGNVPESVPEGRRGEESTAEQGAEGQQEEIEPTAKEDESDGATAAEMARPSFIDVIKMIAEKGKEAASKLFQRSFFDVAETPDFMRKLGVSGEKFTIAYGVMSRHFDKDANHNLTEEEWEQLPDALQHPFAITKYYSDKEHQKQKGYRIYTAIPKGDGFVVVGVDVKRVNQGKDKPVLEINSISTVFGKDGAITELEEEIYRSDAITPEQQSLLERPNPSQYPAEREQSRRKDSNNSAEKQENEQKTSNSPLIKGEKWENTGEPQRFKARIRKHADSHGAYFRLGKKLYGLTTADAQLDDYLVETYGNYTNIWNAYERGEILLSPELAAAIKAKVQFLEEGNMSPKTATIDDAIKFSIRVNHNSPYLLKKADGSFVDPETGERLGFDHRFMGSGEGAQAHGFGSYFSVQDLREQYGSFTEYYFNDMPVVADPYGDKAEERAAFYIQQEGGIKNAIKFLKQMIKDTDDVDEINDYKEQIAVLSDGAAWKHADGNRNHYDVEIPDNDGTNYIEEQEPMSTEQVERVKDALLHDETYMKKLRDEYDNFHGYIKQLTDFDEFVQSAAGVDAAQGRENGRKMYGYLSANTRFGSEQAVSEFLHRAGFVGIHYDGRQDGECYVIFDENDAKIVDHVRFSRKGTKVLTRKGDEAPQASTTYEEGLANARRLGYSKRQYDAMLERQERNARISIANAISKLGLTDNVEVRDSADGLTGRKQTAKGWYDTETGKITIVLDNHHSLNDVMKTILHEGVAHYGLRDLFGEEFDEFLDTVYLFADEDVRSKIDEMPHKSRTERRMATEEYLARLAEETDFENPASQEWWGKVKSWFVAMVRKFMMIYDNISDNELKYLLYRSYRRLEHQAKVDQQTKAENDLQLQKRLKVGQYAEDVATGGNWFDNNNAVADEIGIRFSRANNSQSIFVSNAARAVDGIKQEKATPEQWLKMIENGGGMKAAEDKWLGLSDWLRSQDKKSLTKQEVLDFINENKIQIDEVKYGDIDVDKLFVEEEDAYRLKGDENTYINKNGAAYVDGKYIGSYNIDDGKARIAREKGVGERPLNDTRLQYTTEGLDNKREIALVVPTIEPWNESDDIHFGDAGEGRAVAWVRFGETRDADGNRVLVIDEIQSKRHQEGREKGYKKPADRTPATLDDLSIDRSGDLVAVSYKGSQERFMFTHDQSDEDILGRINEMIANGRINELYPGVPDAPFEKNWHEVAMKRMLRYAAEEGYDKVAWTKGEQQAERYDLSKAVEKIDIQTVKRDGKDVKMVNLKFPERGQSAMYVSEDGIISQANGLMENANGKHVSEVFGKSLAEKIMNTEWETIEGDGLRIGGEGMKGFYDQILPRFMDKYGKKWGVKVGEVTMPKVEEAGRKMWSVDVTPEMKESVMDGQVMFSRRPATAEKEDVRFSRKSMSPEERKEKQLDIVLRENPMNDGYHIGIRKVEDIKTYEETVNDPEADEEFFEVWPDYTRKDAEEALKSGQITIYSSYPIKNGTFVTPSKRNAMDYSGNGKVYSQVVPLEDVAWINASEGEYAKVDKEKESHVGDPNSKHHSAENNDIRYSRRPATSLIPTLQDKPLRDQMGNDQWTDEMHRLYAAMGESERRQIVHKMLQSGGRGALANAMSGWMADRVFGYDEQPDGWDEVRNSVRQWTRGLGYDGVLTDGECDYILWRSNLAERQGGRMSVRDMVDDTLLRERLGIDPDDPDPNDGARFSRTRNLDKEDFGEKQYIRTQNFKDWFGDWEKDPKNASKVVDKNGEPKVMYRGDAETINIFDREKSKYSNLYGRGFYFTDDESHASQYGVAKKYYLDIKQPLDNSHNITKEQMRAFLEAVAKNEDDYSIYNYGTTDIDKILNDVYGKSDFDMLQDVSATAIGDLVEATELFNKVNGTKYDGFILPTETVVFKSNQIKSATGNNGEFNGNNPDIRFSRRSVDDEIRQSRPRRPLPRTTASQSVAGRIYNEGVMGFWNDIKEGYHDYLRSVRVLQDAVAAESGKPLQDHENVYLHNLFLQRRNQAEWQQYMNRLVEPLLDTIKGITRNAKDKEAAEVELGRYLNAVHGLERNEYMAKQHPKTPRKDYSGLTAIFTRSGETNVPIDELEQRARDFIADYENRIGDKAKDDLWKGIDSLRTYMLDKMYNSGLITKALHDELKDRYKHYVPLRGWRDETKGTAEDFYNYVQDGQGSGESIMQKAEGRNSEAADILATLMHLGHAAIHQGNKNRALQSLLALAEDHKVPLLTAKLAWYEKQNVGGVDTWVIIAPPDTSAMNETDAADALNQFEADMRAKMQAEPTRYKNGGSRVDVGVPVNHIGNLKQHQVRVMRGGKMYIININGQPKAAQALNGQLKENAPKWVEGLNRFIARNLTTLNPEFIVSNFERDFTSANVMTFARYGLKEAAKMDKSMFNNLWKLFSLYKKGQLDMSNEQHRLFDEFMRNGGETGFGIVLQPDDYQKRIMDAVKNKHNFIEAILSVIEAGNRGIENMMRFAAYTAARKSGRSILQAINDSAEVSVNFNRTGSGAMGAKYFKGLYVFFNAGVQGLAQRAQGLFQLNLRMYAAIGCEMALGFLISALNIYWGGDDDDDELDEPYMRLGEFRRYNSINIMLPWWDKALRWDLSHEDAAWYGIGAIIGEYAMGYHHYNELAKLLFGQLTQALPIDLAAYHDGDMGIIEAPLREIVPTVARPWMEAYSWNEDFQGRPINNQKVKGELGDNSILPEYRRVTKRNEISLANAFVEWMDKANGADDYHRSWYEKALGNFAPNADNINYIVGGYLGGPWTFMNKVRMTVSGEAELRDYPIASRLMTDIGSDYAKNRQLKSEFDYYHGMVEETENREKVAKRDFKEANGKKRISRKDEAKAYELLENDFGYRLQQIWKSGRGRKTLEKRYEKAIEERKQLYKIGDTEGIERNQAEIYSIMRDAVKAWREAE